jgi:hypothetical protein
MKGERKIPCQVGIHLECAKKKVPKIRKPSHEKTQEEHI